MTAAGSDHYQLRYRIGFWSLLSLVTLVRLALATAVLDFHHILLVICYTHLAQQQFLNLRL